MAGSPLRRMRKFGIPVENRGDSPPSGRPGRADVRARIANLPPDADLIALAKCVLLDVMNDAELDRDRIAAARAMLEVRAPAPLQVRPDQNALRDDTGHIPSEQLDALAARAEAALEGQEVTQ